MNRRQFLQYSGVFYSTCALAKPTVTSRTFEVTTQIEIENSKGPTQVWLPAVSVSGVPFQKTISNHFTAREGTAKLIHLSTDKLSLVHARFPAGIKPVLTLVTRVSTANYAVNLFSPSNTETLSAADRAHYLRSTKFIPIDGIVKATASDITLGANTDLQKAQAIYNWIVENTTRDPKIKGCGLGDIRFMLESKDLRGKCADLNSLFVGLVRASGLPARDVFGIRTAKSELGNKSLGASSETITKAQHCRAEVWLTGYGWVPVDPADVRKVILEETADKVPAARQRLFGSWEMNWMAYNFAHDVELPGSTGAPLGFFMYPQAETAEGRLDCLDPDNFKYKITVREL